MRTTITTNKARIGNFTSGKIAALTARAKDGKSFGKPALNYIEEKNMERRLGRALDVESNAKPLSWGKLVEARVFELLGTEYQITSTETDVHPMYDFWAGSKDGIKHMEGGNAVFDIKCPLTMKSFCQFADCKTIEDVIERHPDGETYFWQLVSNAIINGLDKAELIVYCPYKSELPEIRDLASSYDGNQNKMAWVYFAEDEDLPYLVDGGYYKNIVVIPFDVTEEHKTELTERVLAASKLLIPRINEIKV